jgi:hypothetical protein
MVLGHFPRGPGRELDLRIRVLELDLRYHQALVLAVKYVDLPSPSREFLEVARLVYEGPLAEPLQHLARILGRDRILVLGPRYAFRLALDRKPSLVSEEADADGPLLRRAEVGLDDAPPRVRQLPFRSVDQEFSLDLNAHAMMILPSMRGAQAESLAKKRIHQCAEL